MTTWVGSDSRPGSEHHAAVSSLKSLRHNTSLSVGQLSEAGTRVSQRFASINIGGSSCLQNCLYQTADCKVEPHRSCAA